jgi:hypothetical protein
MDEQKLSSIHFHFGTIIIIIKKQPSIVSFVLNCYYVCMIESNKEWFHAERIFFLFQCDNVLLGLSMLWYIQES